MADTDNSTPASESALDVNQAAELLAGLNLFGEANEPKPEAPAKVDTEVDPPKPKEDPAPDPDAKPNAADEGGDAPITVKIDGKDVVLTQEQIAEAYKGQLRQADYTKKTMEAAETRKAAESEINKTRAERQHLATTAQQNAQLLTAVLAEQNKIDWNALAATDPAEWVKQRNLYDQRQSALAQNTQFLRDALTQDEAENAKSYQDYRSGPEAASRRGAEGRRGRPETLRRLSSA